ncbi:MAG: hypothetical protein WCO56_11480, partial [Verrucomicrobiota bacterium]
MKMKHFLGRMGGVGVMLMLAMVSQGATTNWYSTVMEDGTGTVVRPTNFVARNGLVTSNTLPGVLAGVTNLVATNVVGLATRQELTNLVTATTAPLVAATNRIALGLTNAVTGAFMGAPDNAVALYDSKLKVLGAWFDNAFQNAPVFRWLNAYSEWEDLSDYAFQSSGYFAWTNAIPGMYYEVTQGNADYVSADGGQKYFTRTRTDGTRYCVIRARYIYLLFHGVPMSAVTAMVRPKLALSIEDM